MSHWDQIKRQNRESRSRKSRSPLWQTALVVVTAIVLWVLMLKPFFG